MLGNPLVRFCEGQGGNQMMVRVTPNLRAPCLLDPGFNRVTLLNRICLTVLTVSDLPHGRETVETASEIRTSPSIARLKPGVNEMKKAQACGTMFAKRNHCRSAALGVNSC